MMRTQYFITEHEARMAAGLKIQPTVTLCADHNPPWRAMWDDGEPEAPDIGSVSIEVQADVTELKKAAAPKRKKSEPEE